jgi:hypothetical protein
MFEAAAHGGERRLYILHHLHCLRAEALGDPAISVDARLSGKVDYTVRADDLNDVAGYGGGNEVI